MYSILPYIFLELTVLDALVRPRVSNVQDGVEKVFVENLEIHDRGQDRFVQFVASEYKNYRQLTVVKKVKVYWKTEACAESTFEGRKRTVRKLRNQQSTNAII